MRDRRQLLWWAPVAIWATVCVAIGTALVLHDGTRSQGFVMLVLAAIVVMDRANSLMLYQRGYWRAIRHLADIYRAEARGEQVPAELSPKPWNEPRSWGRNTRN